MEKRVYFVRHGEIPGNNGPVRGGPDSSLNEVGIAQAALVAVRVARLPTVDAFVASSMRRACQTADIISEKIGKPYERSDLFIELRRPSVQIGRPKDDPEVVAAEAALEKYYGEGFKHSDEETFEEFKARAAAALAFLAERPEGSLLVVTHGLFLRMLVGYALYGEALTGAMFRPLLARLKTQNTGITVFEHGDSGWWLRTWNDHAHLG